MLSHLASPRILGVFASFRAACHGGARIALHFLSICVLLSGMAISLSHADDSKDATYLSRSYDMMRAQMQRGDLEGAARTLSRIDQVAGGDLMAQVLAAELTLRNGQYALAVMRLADILEMPQITQQVRDEARLLIDTATMMHSRPVLALTTQLADHAGVPGLPATPRYIYVVASSDFENTAGLRAGLRPPALPPLAAPGGATAELPAAPDDALVAAAIITPSPAAPSDAPADMPDDIQTDGGEDTPDDLLLLLFEDPGNLELNFALFQQQLSEDDLDGASATMERVLLIDPRSKLARILLADVQLRKGNLILARSTLRALLAEDDTPVDMAARATTLLAAVDERLDPVSVQTKLALETGNTENAFGRANADEVLLLNLPITNSTPKKSDIYHSYAIDMKVTRDLNRQTPTLMEAGFSVSGRDTTHKSLSDQRTISANLSFTEDGPMVRSAGLFVSHAQLNRRNFNRSAGAFVGAMVALGDNWQLGPSISVSRSEFSDYSGIANNKNRTSQSYVGRLSISRQFENALINLALSAGRAKARDDIYSLRYEKAELSLASMIGAFSLTGSLSRQWSRNDKADLFVSPVRPEQRKDINTLKLRYPRGSIFGDFFFIPYLRFTAQSTKSNIPNNRREGSEAALGIETVF